MKKLLMMMLVVLSVSVSAESVKFNPDNYVVNEKTLIKNDTKIQYGMTFVTIYYYDDVYKCLIVKHNMIDTKDVNHTSVRYCFSDLSAKDVTESNMYLYNNNYWGKYEGVDYLEDEIKICGKLTKFNYSICRSGGSRR